MPEAPDPVPERDPPEPSDLETLPAPDGVDTEGVGSEGFGTDGVGTGGFGTVGVGNDGVLTVGTRTVGTGTVGTGTVGTGTEGVVTGGLTGVEGTVSDGTVSAALAWPIRGAPPRSVRTTASSARPDPHRAARRSQPPDSWPLRVAACRPLIAAHSYPVLTNSNPAPDGRSARALSGASSGTR